MNIAGLQPADGARCCNNGNRSREGLFIILIQFTSNTKGLRTATFMNGISILC